MKFLTQAAAAFTDTLHRFACVRVAFAIGRDVDDAEVDATTLINDHRFLGLVNNRHPRVPESMLGASYRLMLHGLAAESLHAYLVKQKRKYAALAAGSLVVPSGTP